MGKGVVFRVVFWIAFHESGLPLAGLSPSPAKMPLWEQGNELISHMLYGLTVELTRGFVRGRLGRAPGVRSRLDDPVNTSVA